MEQQEEQTAARLRQSGQHQAHAASEPKREQTEVVGEPVPQDVGADTPHGFELLAAESVEHLFGFLDGADLCVCSLVCKDWNAFVNRCSVLWKNLLLSKRKQLAEKSLSDASETTWFPSAQAWRHEYIATISAARQRCSICFRKQAAGKEDDFVSLYPKLGVRFCLDCAVGETKLRRDYQKKANRRRWFGYGQKPPVDDPLDIVISNAMGVRRFFLTSSDKELVRQNKEKRLASLKQGVPQEVLASPLLLLDALLLSISKYGSHEIQRRWKKMQDTALATKLQEGDWRQSLKDALKAKGLPAGFADSVAYPSKESVSDIVDGYLWRMANGELIMQRRRMLITFCVNNGINWRKVETLPVINQLLFARKDLSSQKVQKLLARLLAHASFEQSETDKKRTVEVHRRKQKIQAALEQKGVQWNGRTAQPRLRKYLRGEPHSKGIRQELKELKRGYRLLAELKAAIAEKGWPSNAIKLVKDLKETKNKWKKVGVSENKEQRKATVAHYMAQIKKQRKEDKRKLKEVREAVRKKVVDSGDVIAGADASDRVEHLLRGVKSLTKGTYYWSQSAPWKDESYPENPIELKGRGTPTELIPAYYLKKLQLLNGLALEGISESDAFSKPLHHPQAYLIEEVKINTATAVEQVRREVERNMETELEDALRERAGWEETKADQKNEHLLSLFNALDKSRKCELVKRATNRLLKHPKLLPEVVALFLQNGIQARFISRKVKKLWNSCNRDEDLPKAVAERPTVNKASKVYLPGGEPGSLWGKKESKKKKKKEGKGKPKNAKEKGKEKVTPKKGQKRKRRDDADEEETKSRSKRAKRIRKTKKTQTESADEDGDQEDDEASTDKKKKKKRKAKAVKGKGKQSDQDEEDLSAKEEASDQGEPKKAANKAPQKKKRRTRRSRK